MKKLLVMVSLVAFIPVSCVLAASPDIGTTTVVTKSFSTINVSNGTGAGNIIATGPNKTLVIQNADPNNPVVTINNGRLLFTAPTGGSGNLTSPMTNLGDIIIGGTNGTPLRLGLGTLNYFLMAGSTSPAYVSPVSVKAILGLTASDVGLGNVNNTSDLNKPISTATQSALNGKLSGTIVTTLGNPGLDTNIPSEAAVRAAISSGGQQTGNLSESGSSILTITGGSNSVVGTGVTIQVKQASGSQSGYLNSSDYNTFNNKQNNLGFTPANISNNLSDLLSASSARLNLGLVIGTNVQPYSSNLTSFAGVTPSANAQTILGHTFSQMQNDLGLVVGVNVQPYSPNLTAFAGISPSANVQTLLGASNYSAFKSSLSLNNVENTTLSIWRGTSNIDTIGTISSGNVPWSFISLTPTTLSGYGITDGVTNSISVNGHYLTSNVVVTAGDVGLGNVNNTSDVNKPISIATQSALNTKPTATLVTNVGDPGLDTNIPSEAAVRAAISSGGVVTGDLTESGSSVLTITGGH